MINDGKLFKAQIPERSLLAAPADGAAAAAADSSSPSPSGSSRRSVFSHLGPPASDKERAARERIDAQKYDVEAWEILADEAQSRPIAHATGIFELLVSTFPTAGKFWKMYAEAMIKASNDDAVRHIFSRCLLSCFHLELWKCYIKFIRRVNEQKGPESKEETRKAFEFTVGHVGMDISAGPLWFEYITFLKTMPISSPQEEAQRMLLLRKAYQQAVLSPIHHIEQLWKEYESFENTISRALAKGLVADFQPKHFNARAVYRERKKFWDQIDQSLLPVPFAGSFKEEQQNSSWKQLLAFEKNNPQRLEPALLARRVVFTYEQCLMYFYHYPDIWYDYAMWLAQNGSNDNAAVVFGRALIALPDATIIYYAYAEFEEARGSIKDAKKIYETLVSHEKIANSLAHIQLMRFVRRTEGIEAARKVFSEARKSPSCTYHLYVACAVMVFCVDKDPKVARDIFELGLKKYIHEPSYVTEYADFLCRLNDDRNVRALFERALNVLPAEESVEVWNRFLAFEQMYGDIPSMLKVAQRRKEALTGDDGVAVASSESSMQQLISRYRFLDLWPCSSQDLDHLAQQQIMLQKLEEKQLAIGNVQGAKKSQNSVATPPKNLIRPDVSQMTPYDPKPAGNDALVLSGLGLQGSTAMPGLASRAGLGRGPADDSSMEELLRLLPPAVKTFLSQLPPVDGPIPDVDLVISILLENEVPNPTGPNGSTKSAAATSGRAGRHAKRKDLEAQEEDDAALQSQAAQSGPKDVFRMRQLQRSRAVSNASAKRLQQSSTSSGLSAEKSVSN
ncbi:hypothetical protein SELMODRAFT_270661 [Selaginella moellendorffii]|uniref:Suppressor of forked domain-containing protein n=1 Tax=Selaginella moellendorffii TaxID=88036 RepID=D8RA86_SELML|nr:cleavage stimulation factor subunit 77 [Selaginella moellendorffii]EFJ31023.1 hypothetical protein SELMODRAFT_270661 [Selaginella moellendorffii]|eukprot:XP_024528216.1 cleavage stimulation factor subunit 77 [Selaginella moellendorffii]